MSRLELPVYEMQNIHELAKNTGYIGCGNESKPIIATCGIGSCIGIAGYCSKPRIGFLAHINDTSPNPTYTRKKKLLSSLDIITKTASKCGLLEKGIVFNTIIVQGQYCPDLPLKVLEYLYSKKNGVIFNIVEEDLKPLEVPNTKSIALDLRSGKLYSYKPIKQNESQNNTNTDINSINLIHWEISHSLKR